MPLLDRTLWFWLYCKANHKDYTNGNLKRGELLTTIDEMRQAMRYRSGYSFRKPGRMVIWRSLGRYRERDMIVTRKTTRGLIITICDYDIYQSPDNYEIRTGAHIGTASDTTADPHYKQECNKNDKNKEGGKPTPFSFKKPYLETFESRVREELPLPPPRERRANTGGGAKLEIATPCSARGCGGLAMTLPKKGRWRISSRN